MNNSFENIATSIGQNNSKNIYSHSYDLLEAAIVIVAWLKILKNF